MSCYASGKRPMPPKKDYSFGPFPQTRPTPNREGDSRPLDESQAATSAAGRQPEVPQRQPIARQATERPPTEANQPARQEGRNKGKENPETPTGSFFFPGSTSAAAEGSQAAGDDGFIVPKKKKKNTKSAARRKRERERRLEKKRGIASAPRTDSDGEGRSGMEAEESSTESERGSRSLSPTLRLGLGIGPLAMVVHENNMFGALQDPYSDEDAPDVDEPQDSTMTDIFPRKIHFTEPVVQRIGYTSPPAEGSQKRARLSASGAH